MSALVSVALFWLTLQNALSCVNYKREPFIKTPHVAALILARGGSKGITLKNLQTVGNETLLGRALTTINQIKFSSIWVSTDHFSIALEADKYGANIHWRSAETATDQASSISAAQEFLVHHSIVDGVALIQCTSPFNKKEYLQRGFDLFGFHECVFSVTSSFKLRWEKVNGTIKPANFDPKNRPRRQDFKKEYVENGMFYFATRKLIGKGYFQSNR